MCDSGLIDFIYESKKAINEELDVKHLSSNLTVDFLPSLK